MKNIAILLVLCLMPFGALCSGAPQSTVQGAASTWADSHLKAQDELLCAKQVHGESFFVARNGDRLKLGYKVHVNDPSSPFALVAVWRVFDEQGQRATSQVLPETVASRIVKDNDGRLFSESVEYQTLKGSPKAVVVQAKLKKCLSDHCSFSQSAGKGETEYVIDVCK